MTRKTTEDIKRDPVMKRVREQFKKSEMTLDAVGQRMGYKPETAKKSVWQFLRSNDPRISMLRRFCRALKIRLSDITQEKKL